MLELFNFYGTGKKKNGSKNNDDNNDNNNTKNDDDNDDADDVDKSNNNNNSKGREIFILSELERGINLKGIMCRKLKRLKKI